MKNYKRFLQIAAASVLLWANSCANMPSPRPQEATYQAPKPYKKASSGSIIEKRLPRHFVIDENLGEAENMPALDYYIGVKTGNIIVFRIEDQHALIMPTNLEERLKQIPQKTLDSLAAEISYHENSMHIDKKHLYRAILKVREEPFGRPKDSDVYEKK